MASYSWFRVHHGMVSDPKWPLIARRSGHNAGTVVAVWTALLDFASQNEERGSLRGFLPAVIDALYGYEDGTTEKILREMEQLGMIVDDVIVSWEKRQAAKTVEGSKSTAMSPAERSRLYRERKRASRNETTASRDVTACHEEETSRHVTQRDATEPSRDATAVQRDVTTDKIREEKNREENTDPPLPPLGEPDAVASAVSEQAETDTLVHPEPEEHQETSQDTTLSPEQQAPKKRKKSRKDRRNELPVRPQDFERWYHKLYPRHEARQDAVCAWNDADEDGVLPDMAVLEEALEWQIPANNWTPGRKQYIPLPATYINARRWQDEPPIVTRASPGPQAQGVYGAPCQPHMKQPFSKADELTYVIQQNRINAAQALAELEAEDRAREMAQHEY